MTMHIYEDATRLEDQVMYLNMQASIGDEHLETVLGTIHDLRKAFFDKYMSILLQYATPWERENRGSKLVDCTVYILDHGKKAIRSFNGLYYLVDVEENHPGVSIRTKCPDDYPLHVMPMEGFLYPELAIIDYMKNKKINITQFA